jgi:phosphatidate cytidylyltransferase
VGGWWLVGVVAAVNAIAVNEFYNFIRAKGAEAQRVFGTGAAAVLPLVVYVGDASLATSFLTAVLLATLLLQLFKQRIDEAIASVAATFFGVFYVGWLLSHAVSVRFLSADPRLASAELPPEAGIFFTLFTLCAVVGSDAGAFFVGRWLGRHKLAPHVSPGKTVEGALGGVGSGALLALACKAVFLFWIPGDASASFSWTAAAAIGAALAGIGVLGDLIESLLKRDAHVKDAGHIVPGVGGALDRIDSALLAFPLMYYLLLAYYRLGMP